MSSIESRPDIAAVGKSTGASMSCVKMGVSVWSIEGRSDRLNTPKGPTFTIPLRSLSESLVQA